MIYITNDWEMTADEVIAEARSRCDQENLIGQLKSGRAGPARPGQHPDRQPGLHDHGIAGLDAEDLVRAAAARLTRWAETTYSSDGASSPWSSPPSSKPSSPFPARSCSRGADPLADPRL